MKIVRSDDPRSGMFLPSRIDERWLFFIGRNGVEESSDEALEEWLGCWNGGPDLDEILAGHQEEIEFCSTHHSEVEFH